MGDPPPYCAIQERNTYQNSHYHVFWIILAIFITCLTVWIGLAFCFGLSILPPFSKASESQDSQANSTKCDPGWKYYDHTDFCYFLGGEYSNNTAAQKLCADQEAQLASIHSRAENTFILNYVYSNWKLSGKAPVWIGLYRTGPYATDFANYDGTPLDYTNWGEISTDKEPDNWHGEQYCTQMMVSVPDWPDGVWSDLPCNAPRPLYICKKPANKN